MLFTGSPSQVKKTVVKNFCNCVLIVLQLLNIPVNNFGARRSVLVLVLTKFFVCISISNRNLRKLLTLKLFFRQVSIRILLCNAIAEYCFITLVEAPSCLASFLTNYPLWIHCTAFCLASGFPLFSSEL